MKKTVIFVVAAVLLLCGCGAQESSETPRETAAPQTAAVETAPAASGAVPQTVDGHPAKLVHIQTLAQLPELPTGCEVTSLAAVLRYYGFDIDKCEIGDRYLDKGAVGTVDFREAFEGDPRDEDAYGCYAPVIVNAANRILTERGSAMRAAEVSGRELEDLFGYLDRDIPVIIWGTLDCAPSEPTTVWDIGGKQLQWIYPEHCMVLAGYSDADVWVCDPMSGKMQKYEKELFKAGYNALLRQAIVIQ